MIEPARGAVRNHTSQLARAVFALQAERRWAVTGTPLQNRLGDVLSDATIRAAFDGSDGRRWEELRDGGLHIAEGGEVSTDLAAGLYAWRRPVES